MFDNLISSAPPKQRTLGQSIVSFIVHGVLILAAVKATQGAAETLKEVLQDTTVVFLEVAKQAEPEPPPPDVVVSANPPPKGFQVVVAPDVIPTEIPPVNINEKFDPKNFTGKGVEGGIATGIVGGTGPVILSGETFLEAQVDDPPQMIVQGPRRYPPVLERAGIGGRVEAQFIVDTTGHAEPSSFKVLSSSNKAFEEPAREMILKSVFKPGKVRGTPVRVLVQQAVRFDAPNR